MFRAISLSRNIIFVGGFHPARYSRLGAMFELLESGARASCNGFAFPPLSREVTMRLRISHLAWVLLLVVTFIAPMPSSPGAAKGMQPTSQLPPEVRLRKLHLVRPDLIPYPIALEVYC